MFRWLERELGHLSDPQVGKIPWRRKMATHSSILAWRIPRTEVVGGLQSMGSHRVGHGWVSNTQILSELRLSSNQETHGWRQGGINVELGFTQTHYCIQNR